MTRKPQQSLLKNLMLLFFTTFFFLGLLEVGFRIFTTQPGPWLINTPEAKKHRKHSIYIHSKNPNLLYRSRENYFKRHRRVTEKHGILSDKHFSKKKPKGVYRIAVIGDSVSAPWPQGEGIPYPTRLERLFNERGKKVQVLNFSVIGYGPHQEAITFETKSLSFAPDLVILQFCPNDLGDSIAPGSYFRYKSHSHSAILNFFKDRYTKSHSPELKTPYTSRFGPVNAIHHTHWQKHYDKKGNGWKRLVKSYQRIAHIAKANKLPVVFLQFPFLLTDTQYQDVIELFHKQVSQQAKKTGFYVVDLDEYLLQFPLKRVREPPGVDHFHISEYGHQRVAEHLYRFLTKSKYRKIFRLGK